MSGKGKLKEKERETKFDKNQIDAVCLAYDIFVYSASKFGVHENCLAAWEGPKNDYGQPPHHFRYICRPVIVNQLKFRLVWNEWIELRLKNDELESFEPVCQVLENVIKSLAKIKTKIELVEESLAVACELILYLYAKGKGLYLNQLAEHWFECYFRKAKKRFEKDGGFEAVCWRGYLNVCDYPHNFINLCITSYKYNDYEKSVQDEDLVNKFMESSRNHIKKKQKYKCPKPSFVLKKSVQAILFQHVSIPKPETASGDSLTLPPNPALGVPLPQEMYGTLLAGDAVQSLNLPEADVQEPSKHVKELSHRERRNGKSTPRPNVTQPSSDSYTAANVKPTFTSRQKKDEDDSEVDILQNPGLGVPLPQELYVNPSPGDAVESQNLPEASVQELSKRSTRPSYLDRKRTKKTSSRSSMQQGIGPLSFDSSTTTGTVQSYDRQGARPKDSVQSIGSSSLQTGESSSCSRVDQGIGQLSLDP